MQTREINSLVLAYIGDTVYENYIRHYLVSKGIANVNDLQREAVHYVSAVAQAEAVKKMIASSFLTVSATSRTSTFTVLVPKAISMTSPVFTAREAFALLPFTVTRPASQASLATVLRLIRRETFRNLSSRIRISLRHPSELYRL